MPPAPFLGLDLAALPTHPSALLGLGPNLELAHWGFYTDDEAILAAVRGLRPLLVAIDAPLVLPAGMDCLEENCPCSGGLRQVERELARRGFPCFYTTKRSIVKALALRGRALRERLEREGYSVLEVYPYAAKRLLFGAHPPRKATPEGRAWLRDKLPRLLPCLLPHQESLSHHLADAALAAYTAYLHHRGQTEMVGRAEDGFICLPLPPGEMPRAGVEPART